MRVSLLRPLIAAVLSMAASGVWLAAEEEQLAPVAYVGDAVAIPDYREWIFMGSGMFPGAQPGQDSRFSNIFVSPTAYRRYAATGVWPDRTVILSEKRTAITTVPITSGNGWGQTGEPLGFELEVKDASKGGWMYYVAGPAERAAKLVAKQSDCTTCHQEKGAVDNTFVQFYPRLVAPAKSHGTYKPSN